MKHKLFVDQYGNKWFAKTIKELCKKIGYSKAQRMYRDKKDGSSVHVGYVVGPHWLDMYIPYEAKA